MNPFENRRSPDSPLQRQTDAAAAAPICGIDRRVRGAEPMDRSQFRPRMRADEFWRELKRRNVWRVAILDALICWFILDSASETLVRVGAAGAIRQEILLAMLFGFVAVLLLAWFYEITPDGIRRSDQVDRRRSLVGKTGRYLDRAIYAVVALTLAYMAIDKFWLTAYGSGL